LYSKPISDIATFEDKLLSTFRGRLLIRWSNQRGEWHIEQRIRRGLLEGIAPTKKGWDESSDAYRQYRDGTVLVMAVRTGDRMPCPRCGTELKVPYMETEHLKCFGCKRLKGENRHVVAVYMPLGDVLIDHLKAIDPERSHSQDLDERVDAANVKLEDAMVRAAVLQGDAAVHEDYRRIVGIQQVGLSGKTAFWQDKK
jgi:hypothetical protein